MKWKRSKSSANFELFKKKRDDYIKNCNNAKILYFIYYSVCLDFMYFILYINLTYYLHCNKVIKIHRQCVLTIF